MGAIATVWRIFSKYRWHLALLMVLGFFSAILEGVGINTAIPLLSFLVSGGQPNDIISRTVAALFSFAHIPFTFRFLLGFIVALFLTRAVATVVFGYVRGWISTDFLITKSETLFQKTFAASWPYLLRQKLGYVQATLTRDVQQTVGLLENIGQVIQSFTAFSMYFLVALNISPFVTVSTLVCGGVLLLTIRPLVRRMRARSEGITGVEKEVWQFLGEHILGMKIVKAAGVEVAAYARSARLFDYLRALNMRVVLLRGLSTSLFQPFSIFFGIVLFSVAYTRPGFSLIAFAATLYLIQKMFSYLEMGQNALNNALGYVPYASNIEGFERLLDTHREVRTVGSESFMFARDIVFNGVSFSYTEGRTVLQEVTFSITKGETIAIIGPSGAGKTTVADLLLRLFEPTAGDISVDGVPLSNIALAQWRAHIGYVAQDVFLLNDTVEENIRFYYPDLSREAIESAAKRANIHDFIMTLPDGYATVVGDRGVLLSGGQRQRIALARALTREPEILLLDEATSALDTESEKLIQDAIRDLQGRVTVLIIAHRLTTIAHADKIITLEGGRLIEIGSPKELEKTGGYYARVVDAH